MKVTRLLAASAAVALLTAPAVAETLKKVPAKLDPAKAYVLVEYKLQKNPMASFPGSRKYMPLSVGLVFARYDPALGDVRGLGKAAGIRCRPSSGRPNRSAIASLPRAMRRGCF